MAERFVSHETLFRGRHLSLGFKNRIADSLEVKTSRIRTHVNKGLKPVLGVKVHASNPSPLEPEAGGFLLSSLSAWATK